VQRVAFSELVTYLVFPIWKKFPTSSPSTGAIWAQLFV